MTGEELFSRFRTAVGSYSRPLTVATPHVDVKGAPLSVTETLDVAEQRAEELGVEGIGLPSGLLGGGGEGGGGLGDLVRLIREGIEAAGYFGIALIALAGAGALFAIWLAVREVRKGIQA